MLLLKQVDMIENSFSRIFTKIDIPKRLSENKKVNNRKIEHTMLLITGYVQQNGVLLNDRIWAQLKKIVLNNWGL